MSEFYRKLLNLLQGMKGHLSSWTIVFSFENSEPFWCVWLWNCDQVWIQASLHLETKYFCGKDPRTERLKIANNNTDVTMTTSNCLLRHPRRFHNQCFSLSPCGASCVSWCCCWQKQCVLKKLFPVRCYPFSKCYQRKNYFSFSQSERWVRP